MDDDLDEELLDLIGATGGNATYQRPSAGKKPVGSNGGGGQRKKPAQRKGGRKRRRDSNDDESSAEDSDDGSDFDSSSDADSLFSDDNEEDEEDDLANIEDELLQLNEDLDESEVIGLTELEREALLSERAEKKQRLLEKLEIKKRLQSGGVPKRKTRSTNGKGMKKSNKGLEELKQRRSGKKALSSERFSRNLDEESDYDGEDYRDRIRSTYSSGRELSAKKGRQITMEELNSIRLSRDQLEKNVFLKDFADIAVGCFVRLGIGIGPNRQQAYRVCQIMEVVDYHKSYKINNTLIKKALLLKHGRAEKIFLMDVISNGDFTESEYNRWVQVMQAESQRFPSLSEIEHHQESIKHQASRTLTNGEIDFMVEEKRKLGKVVIPTARQKLMLLTEKEIALERDDAGKLQDISARLDQLNGDSPRKKDVWAELNERNRKINREESAFAERLAKEQRGKGTEGSNAADPFARIKAATTHIFVTPGPASAGILSPTESNGPLSATTVTNTLSERSANTSGATTPVKCEMEGDAFQDVLANVEIDIDI